MKQFRGTFGIMTKELKESSSQLNKCYNSIHCNLLFVNNLLLSKKHLY